MDPSPEPQPPPRPGLDEPSFVEWPAGPIEPPLSPFDPAPPSEPSRRRVDRWTVVLSLLGGVLLGTGVTLAILGLAGVLEGEVETVAPTAAPSTTPPPPVELGPSPSVTQVAAAAVPSIVAVEVSGPGGLVGGGSGVVYRDDGYLITNHHVVEGAAEILVIFSDGVAYSAELVGTDPLTDIAVLSTPRPDLTPIRLGTEADLVIGERTVAVGNPLGLEGGPSVTSGILSATGRSLTVRTDMRLFGLLQTDAPITRGSSGGALLDQEAKLIGITTAIGVSDVGAEGLGFAVPVDVAVSVADDLIAEGRVRHALLGISGTTATETRQDAIVPLGVGVNELSSESAYGEAGGRRDDVIIRLNGRPVTSIDQLIAMLRIHRAGEEVTVDVLRGGDEITLTVTLGEWDL